MLYTYCRYGLLIEANNDKKEEETFRFRKVLLNQEPSRKLFKLSDTYLLALVPKLSYGLLYFYESGYLAYFGAPSQYISVELPELFYTSAIFLSTSLPVYFFLDLFYQFSNLLKHNRNCN